MANTTNYNLPYPTDYTAVADVPAAIQSLAEATDTALGDKADTSDLTSYQLISNLVTSIDSNSTDTQYPSAKCVYDTLTDYVTNTDYASASTGGVIKRSNYYGLNTDNDGNLLGVGKTLSDYNSAPSSLIIAKGTLENVLTAVIGDINTILDNINGEVV